jgi:uncharacterized protein involved in response to NO
MSTDSLPIFNTKAQRGPAPQGWPGLRLGFRPFYLGGALVASCAVPAWAGLFLGWFSLPTAVPALLWHAHEMLFGFAVAIIVGFLLTAGKAWTGLATPRGPTLGALALLWLAARVASISGPGWAYALLDILLLPAVAFFLGLVLWRAGNRRNLPLVAILLLLACANAVFHLCAAGLLAWSPLVPLEAGLGLIVMIECVIAGRVVPAFTISATPGLRLNAPAWREQATLAASFIGLALWVLLPTGWPAAVALALASVLQAVRLIGWKPWLTRRRPILWILHAAYAWIPVGLALLALGELGLVPMSAGIHALAVGATGGLIIGMITRTARGHTGRLLQVSRLEVTAYGLVLLAAAVRVLLPLAAPAQLPAAVAVAALAWSAGFVCYLVRFTPWLMSTRLDGKDG